MKNAIKLLKPPVLPDNADMAADESKFILSIAGVYQDSVTRDWAMQACHRATRLAGEERIQNTWYSAKSLGDPGTFSEAVRAALVADVIVVSVHAADPLPPGLHAWFDAWLPRRPSRAGALAAVIGVAEPPEPQSVRTFEFLRSVASKAQLDFIPQVRQRPGASAVYSIQRIAEQSGSLAPALPIFRGQSCEGYDHCGLND
jgi:hypothetical protein